jgi:hypothetical protein
MSEQPMTFEQIQTMRMAIDMVMSSMGPNARGRDEVVRAIVPHSGVDGHSAATLANLALEKMGVAISVPEDEVVGALTVAAPCVEHQVVG